MQNTHIDHRNIFFFATNSLQYNLVNANNNQHNYRTHSLFNLFCCNLIPSLSVGFLIIKTHLTWTEVNAAHITSCDRGLMNDGRLADCFPCLNIRAMRLVFVSKAP